MAWLQQLSGLLSPLFGEEPEHPDEPDLEYLQAAKARDLHPSLEARQREYVGHGTASRDQAELDKLKAMWDNDAWRRDDVVKPPIQMLGKAPTKPAPSQASNWDNTSYVYPQHGAMPNPNPYPAMPPAPPARDHQTQRDAFSAPRRVHNTVEQAMTLADPTAQPSSVEELRDHLSRMQHERELAVNNASQAQPELEEVNPYAPLPEVQPLMNHYLYDVRPDGDASAGDGGDGGGDGDGDDGDGNRRGGVGAATYAPAVPPRPAMQPMQPPHAPSASLSGVAAALALERGPQIGKPKNPPGGDERSGGDKQEGNRLESLLAGAMREDYRAMTRPAAFSSVVETYLQNDPGPSVAALAAANALVETPPIGSRYGEQWATHNNAALAAAERDRMAATVWSREALVSMAEQYRIAYKDLSDDELVVEVRTIMAREEAETARQQAKAANTDLFSYPDEAAFSAATAATAAPAHPDAPAIPAALPAPPIRAPEGYWLGGDETVASLPPPPQEAETALALVPEAAAEKTLTLHQDTCDSSGMRSLAEILLAVDGDGRIGAAISIRVLCLQNEQNKQHAADLGVISALVDMVSTGSPAANAAACGALQKLCARHTENQLAVVKLRGLDGLVRTSWAADGRCNAEGRKLAILTLRNISNNAAVMDVMVNVGVIPPLIKLIEMAGTNQGLQARAQLSDDERRAAVGAAECLRNVLAAEVLGNPHKEGGLGTVFGKGRPAKLMVDAGLMPAVAGMLRVSRSDAAWCACVGLLNNVCLISQEARNMACNQFIPAYVAEAYMAGGPATRHAACAALWAVYGVSAPPNGKSFAAERSDAPPVCQSDGVNAYHKGRMVSEVWWDPPVLPLVRMIRDGYDAGCEAGCALAARVAVSRGAAAGEASLDAHKEVTVYGASGVPAPAGGAGEDTTGATLDDMRKRRQANDFVNLEEECEVTPDGRTQEAFVRAGGVSGVCALLESGPATTTQPAAALLMDAACCGCHLAAVQAVQDGCVAPLVRMLATGSPFGKAAAASALCSMAEDKEVAAFVTKAGALPQLVLLLTCGDPSGKLQAARTLLRLAMHNPVAVHNVGAVPALAQEVTANLAAGIPVGPTAGRLLLRKQLAICTLLILCRQSPQHQLFVVRAGCVKSLVTLAMDAGERCRRVAVSLMDVLSQHDEAREYMAETAIHGLMAVARDHRASPESVAAAASTLWRISLDSPPRALEVYRAGGIDLVSKLMRNGSAKGRSAAVLLLGELSFCVGVEVMEEVTGMVLALLAERAGHGAAEACLCIQRMVSRGMRASDPRVIIHTQGRCAQNEKCDVCYTQQLFSSAVPTLLRHISGFDYLTDKVSGSMAGVPPEMVEVVHALKEAAVGALVVLVQRNYLLTSKAVSGGALLELCELMSRGATAGARIEAATAVTALCEAGGSVIRLKAPSVGVLVPTFELCEAGMEVDDLFMGFAAPSRAETDRLELWKHAGPEVLVEAYKAGTALLAALAKERDNGLSMSVARPKALHPIVRLAARGELESHAPLDPIKRAAFQPSTPGVQEYTESACACLRELCANPKLHFLLHGAKAMSVLMLRMQDKQFSTAAARTAACGALVNLSALTPEQTALLVPGRGGTAPTELQSLLLQEGVLEAAADVIRWAPEEEVAVEAARLVATLADTAALSAERERCVLALKAPLLALRDERATADATRAAADAALTVLTGVEQRAAAGWAMNTHGQKAVTGSYSMGAALEPDMDLLD